MIPNTYTPNGDGTTSLSITRLNGQTFSFLLDDASVQLVREFQWCVVKQAYAATTFTRRGKDGVLLLHRVLACAPDGVEVDHASGNTFDNRISNLRVATRSENARNQKLHSNNKTGFKGVHYCRTRGRYVAQISFKNENIVLGRFKTAEKAAAAYDSAAVCLHRDFARTNMDLLPKVPL